MHRTLLEALKNGDVTRVTDLRDGRSCLLSGGSLILGEIVEGDDVLVETITPEPHIVLFGAGHVGKAMGDMAHILSMALTVIDEREEMASRERFPYAKEIICEDYSSFLSRDHDFFRPYYVIMTHGHKWDRECLRWCLGKESKYVGMIGSRAKTAFTFSALEAEGVSMEKMRCVHAPIGLPIGAVTPEEIALSVLSEITSVFRSTKTTVTMDPEYLCAVAGRDGIAARIVEKRGSAPRAIGSEIFISADGAVFGTVGGGALEAAVEKECRKALSEGRTGSWTEKYGLDTSSDLGMVCGGNVTVLFYRTEPSENR